MKIDNFFAELKRRNVYKVAVGIFMVEQLAKTLRVTGVKIPLVFAGW